MYIEPYLIGNGWDYTCRLYISHDFRILIHEILHRYTSITLLSKYWFNCSFPKSWNLFLQYIKFETAKWKLIYTKEFIWSENYIFIEIAYIDVTVPIVDMNS